MPQKFTKVPELIVIGDPMKIEPEGMNIFWSHDLFGLLIRQKRRGNPLISREAPTSEGWGLIQVTAILFPKSSIEINDF